MAARQSLDPPKYAPNFNEEVILRMQGCQQIAGIDEAGRGCWAGPVVAAAVVLPTDLETTRLDIAIINDSKQLSALQRNLAYITIQQIACGIGVGIVPAYLIDGLGIIGATRLAMLSAVLSLPCSVDGLLIDALTLPLPSLPQHSLIKGDARSLSIAAASIIAKVTRDRLMHALDSHYPQYGFARHKGYGTAEHQQALQQFGPTALHRHTFQPIAILRTDDS